jgi:tRNA(Arg) A34 adenosine deaminase TadA
MRRCIELARHAIASGDTPVGSLIVDGDEIVSEGVEAVRARQDATAHAEMEALRAAFACIMCAYAIRLARISVVVCGQFIPETWVTRPLTFAEERPLQGMGGFVAAGAGKTSYRAIMPASMWSSMWQ